MVSWWISLLVLLTLTVVLAGSSVTFWLLTRRWTSHRQWVTLADWARENDFSIRPCAADELPPPLDVLNLSPVTVRLCFAGTGITFIQFQTPAPPTGAATLREATWNLLIRNLSVSWRPTGLRPAAADASILDLFSLSGYPALGSPDRFVVFGTDSAEARALSASMFRSLLPPDVGLLLHGRQMVFDFSDRPFDTIEFNRMLSLATQLAEKVPQPSDAGAS